MPIKTVSLETARKLKESGFRQDTTFWWINVPNGTHYKTYNDFGWQLEYGYYGFIERFSAPTTDEILKELPKWIKSPEHGLADFLITKGPKNYTVMYLNCYYFPHARMTKYCIKFVHKELCEALASMWLHLKKEGLL